MATAPAPAPAPALEAEAEAEAEAAPKAGRVWDGGEASGGFLRMDLSGGGLAAAEAEAGEGLDRGGGVWVRPEEVRA